MANNKIKGLTVEIGGDTTNLGKALESVNKKSGDLSTELREIDNLLKFNPDNADLLAQKQKVLAETIENTAEKLETLKEAEKQVQKQFERGEVSEAQVRALQREIVATEGKLEHFREEAKKAADATTELGGQAKDITVDLSGLGGALGAVGKAAAVGMKAIGAGVVAAGTAIVASAEATREYRTEMGKLNTAFETVGHSTETAEEAYKTLQSVIGETDQSVEAAQQIALLANSEKDVAQWADLAAGVVGRFGDALQPETFFEAANETIKLGEATGAYTQMLEGVGYDVEKFNEGLAACTTEQEKQAYMLKITDELLGDAADTYRETNAEVMRANAANEAWMATTAAMGASAEPVITDVKLLGASLVEDLIPGVVGVTDAIHGLLNGEAGAAEQVGEALSALLTQILDKAVALLPTVVEAAVSLISSLIVTITNMLPQLVETLGTILITIIDGINALMPLLIQAIVDMVPKIVETLVACIPQLTEGVLIFLMAIIDAIGLIIPPLLAAIPQIVTALVEGLIMALPQLLAGAFQFLMAIVQAVPMLIEALLPEIPKIVDTVINGLLDNLPLLIDGAITLFFAILEAIPEIIAALYGEMPSIVASIVSGLLSCIPELIKAGGQLLAGLVEGMLNFDILGALSNIGNSIIDGFKSIFGIHSPSRVMAGIGEFLDEGLAVGIEDGAKAPVNALDKLSGDMLDSVGDLNGITVERRMAHATDPSASIAANEGISNKLDQIYQAILRGQVIMLDGKTLVGSTVNRYDTELGQRRVLAERGAI